MSKGFASLLEDGTISYRLSSFGRCLRELVAARQGKKEMPLQEGALVRFGEGDLHEKDVVKRLRADGHIIEHLQKRVELKLEGGEIVVGHVDGVETNDPHVFETKGVSALEFKKVERLGVVDWLKEHKQQAYRWQISGAMLVLELPALYAVKNKESGVIAKALLEEPFFFLEDFQARADEINRWVVMDQLPDCEKTGWCWSGPYRQLHYKKDQQDVTDSQDVALDSLLGRLAKVRKDMNILKVEEAELKEELLTDWGPGDIKSNHWECEITNYTQRRFNGDRFKRENPGLYEDYREEIAATKISTPKVRRA